MPTLEERAAYLEGKVEELLNGMGRSEGYDNSP